MDISWQLARVQELIDTARSTFIDPFADAPRLPLDPATWEVCATQSSTNHRELRHPEGAGWWLVSTAPLSSNDQGAFVLCTWARRRAAAAADPARALLKRWLEWEGRTRDEVDPLEVETALFLGHRTYCELVEYGACTCGVAPTVEDAAGPVTE